MGQALRRVSRSSTPPPPPMAKRGPQTVTAQTESGRRPGNISSVGQDRLNISDSVLDDASRIKDDRNVLEEQDPQYNVMLNKMVGRITSKPGGKLEMGEAFVVESYNRPLPKVRSSTDPAGHERKPLPPGTLTAVQLQQIILLHQGKSNEYQGPMDVGEIAKRFGIDSAQVKRIIQFVALPPEGQKTNDQQ